MIRFGTTRKAPTEDEACLGEGGGKNGWRICVTNKGICTDGWDMDGFFCLESLLYEKRLA